MNYPPFLYHVLSLIETFTARRSVTATLSSQVQVPKTAPADVLKSAPCRTRACTEKGELDAQFCSTFLGSHFEVAGYGIAYSSCAMQAQPLYYDNTWPSGEPLSPTENNTKDKVYFGFNLTVDFLRP